MEDGEIGLFPAFPLALRLTPVFSSILKFLEMLFGLTRWSFITIIRIFAFHVIVRPISQVRELRLSMVCKQSKLTQFNSEPGSNRSLFQGHFNHNFMPPLCVRWLSPSRLFSESAPSRFLDRIDLNHKYLLSSEAGEV